MRLLKCHIENFGTLSDFDYDFSSNFTVICKENGFGKSTFAAFIKAMFYGMPRSGARNIVENERKRYDPWQGGNYGGFIEFEYQGVRYRVTRYFGKTASKDTFEIVDMTNRRVQTPFSEELGAELFQLDADSFARSTYVPQLSSRDMEVTTSIRTKLSNLVDDTNDMNNFDTAMDALRKNRSKLKAYRGNGGKIGDLSNECLYLEHQKDEAEHRRADLEEILERIEEINVGKECKNATISELRKKIQFVSVQKMMYEKQNKLKELRDEKEQQQQEIKKLDAQYPAGYPSPSEVKTQREQLAEVRQAKQRLAALSLSDEDRAAEGNGRAFFSNMEKTSKDIDRCEHLNNDLLEVTAQLAMKNDPDEQEQLRTLSDRFKNGIPSEEELQNAQREADEVYTGEKRIQDLNVSAEDQIRFGQLKERFKTGVPNDETIEDCEQNQKNLNILTSRQENYALSNAESEEYQRLRRMFASKTPTEEEIQNWQRKCRRIVELNGKKNTKITQIQKDQPSTRASKMPVFCGVFGAILLIVGMAFFITSAFIPGIIILVAGIAGLLTAFWLHTRQLIENGRNNVSTITASAITDSENQELHDLQYGLNDFLLSFNLDTENPEEKLVQLILDVRRFLDIQQKLSETENEKEKNKQEIQRYDQALRKVYERFYPETPYHKSFINELREDRHEYEMLRKKIDETNHKRKNLTDEKNESREKIMRLLSRYGQVPDDLRQGVRDLISDVSLYRDLKEKKDSAQNNNRDLQARENELTKQIQEILISYECYDDQLTFSQLIPILRKRFDEYKIASEHVKRYLDDRNEAMNKKQAGEKIFSQFINTYRLTEDMSDNLIERISNDIQRRTILAEHLDDVSEKLRDFMEKNPNVEKIQVENPDYSLNVEDLQKEEKNTQEQIDQDDDYLRELREKRDSICREIDKIPEWTDQVTRLRDERKEAEKKCSVVDQTIELLNRAKDNLATSYVGKVEQGFEKYANELLNGQLGSIFVDQELTLRINAHGQQREVGSFSTGMVDGIVLCMRLSLVDALFTKEKPFLILDDPFVNLDDEHMKRALDILKKIAHDYQVIYMVCNTSRC